MYILKRTKRTATYLNLKESKNLVLEFLERHEKKKYIVIWHPVSGKESACKAGDRRHAGFIPGLGRAPEEGNGNPLQYSCLGNPMDRGAQQAAVHGFAKSET